MEITDYIESYRRKEERKQKQIAIHNQNLADQLLRGISAIFSEDSNNISIKEIWDYYPDLFIEEKKAYQQKQEQEEFERFKERRKQFAYQFNKKYEGDDE